MAKESLYEKEQLGTLDKAAAEMAEPEHIAGRAAADLCADMGAHLVRHATCI